MRIASILTAVFAAVALYALVIEREAVLAFARSAFGSENTDDAVSQQRRGTGASAEIASVEADEADSAFVDDDKSVRVTAIRSLATPVESGVTVRGQTEAMRYVDVRSQVSGIVTSDPLRNGSFVSQGQTICQIDPGASTANLMEAEARLQEARLNARTALSLAEGGFATEARKNSAVAALESAEAAFERAQLAIQALKMTAPFDGLLGSDTAELGSLLQPGSLCARIIQFDPIKVVAYISELEVERIEIGYPATVRFLSGRTATGTVSYISRSADSKTRTFRLELTIPNSELLIRDGSAAEVTVVTERALAHFIPQSALTLNDAGVLGVRTVVTDVARFVPVRFIRDATTGVWVGGLPEQSDIIVVGHEYVIDGTPVAATYREAAL